MSDITIPSTVRRSLRARWAAIGAAVAVSVGAGGGFGLADAMAGDSGAGYSAITPCRLVDTRPGDANVGPRSTPFGAGESVTVAARGAQGRCSATQLPANASALALNVTALRASEQTFLTFWPGATRPVASSLNPAPGAPPTPNAVITQLSADGSFDVYNDLGSVGLIVDVVGYFTDIDLDEFVTDAEQTAAVGQVRNELVTLTGRVDDITQTQQTVVISRLEWRPFGQLAGFNVKYTGDHGGAFIPSGASNNDLWATIDVPAGSKIGEIVNYAYDTINGTSLQFKLWVNGVEQSQAITSASSAQVQVIGLSGANIGEGDVVEISAAAFGNSTWSAAGFNLEIIKSVVFYSPPSV